MDKWVDNVFLGLGSNIGDRGRMLKEAVLLIESKVGELIQQSSVYETQAWGDRHLNDFYNQVIVLRTKLSPMAVLEQCLVIERLMGRVSRNSENYENRLIDIDLLFYDDFSCDEKQLVLPHPFISKRNFVLVPFSEIAAEFIHPKLGLSMRELLCQSDDIVPLKRLES